MSTSRKFVETQIFYLLVACLLCLLVENVDTVQQKRLNAAMDTNFVYEVRLGRGKDFPHEIENIIIDATCNGVHKSVGPFSTVQGPIFDEVLTWTVSKEDFRDIEVRYQLSLPPNSSIAPPLATASRHLMENSN